MAKAMLGAGCFWGVEAYFKKVHGVNDTEVGYSGGHLENPSYKDVCSGASGQSEVLLIEFDENQISFEEILQHFFKMHNPTQKNRQGVDYGEQYRTAIFYYDDAQKNIAQNMINKLNDNKVFTKPIVTIVEEASKFWPAEEYHQDYFDKNGGSCHV